MDALTKAVLGLAIFFSGLIGLVIVVGLVQGKLDPTGIATMLGGVFTGIMGGLFLRWKSTGDGGGPTIQPPPPPPEILPETQEEGA